MSFTTDLDRSNGLLAWSPPTQALANAVQDYRLEISSLDETTGEFQLIETFRLTNDFAVFPENYRNGEDVYYQVLGSNATGNDILYTDIQPACPTCNWEITNQWGCYGTQFAYEIVENTKSGSSLKYYSLRSLKATTLSKSAEYFNNTPQSGTPNKTVWEYNSGTDPFYPGPYISQTGSQLNYTVYGRKLPLGPSTNDDWGPSPITSILTGGTATPPTDIHSAINRFNTYRQGSGAANPQLPLTCNSPYPGAPYSGGGTVIGDLNSNPLENQNLKKNICFGIVIETVGIIIINGTPFPQQIKRLVQVPCDGLQPDQPGLNSNEYLNETVRAITGQNDHLNPDAQGFTDVDKILITQLSGNINPFYAEYNSASIFNASGDFIFSDNTPLLPGVYEAVTLYSDSLISSTTFLVPTADQFSATSFNAVVAPVPNNGEYEIHITSDELKTFQYEVYDLNGNYYFNEPLQIFDYANEVIVPISLDVPQYPSYGQLIHKITGSDGQVQLIQTIYNGN